MDGSLSKDMQRLKLSERKRHRSQRHKRAAYDITWNIRPYSVFAGANDQFSAPRAKVTETHVKLKSEHLYIYTYSPDDSESFERDRKIMCTITKIPALVHSAPNLLKADPSSRVIVLSAPRLRWFPLLTHVETEKINIGQMLGLKQKLRSYIELLYSRGVAYRVKHDFIYPVQKMTREWTLQLAGWFDADFCDDRTQLESAEWKQRETEQLNEIERIFDLLIKRYEDLQDRRVRKIKGHRVVRWDLEDQLRGVEPMKF